MDTVKADDVIRLIPLISRSQADWDENGLRWLVRSNKVIGGLSAALYPVALFFVLAAGHTYPLSVLGPLECIVGFLGGIALLWAATLIEQRVDVLRCQICTVVACLAGAFITITNLLLVLLLNSDSYTFIPLESFLSLPIGLGLLHATRAILSRPSVLALFAQDANQITYDPAEIAALIEEHEENIWQESERRASSAPPENEAVDR